jgi:glycosyltransferase 2 family protein
MPVPDWISQQAYPFAALSISIFVAVLFLAFRRKWLLTLLGQITRWLLPSIHNSLHARLETALGSLNVLRGRRDNLKIIVWSAIVWSTAILTNYLVLRALAIEIPAIAALLLLLVLQIGISLSSVPATIGIFEYLCVLALAVFAVDDTVALSFGVLLHMLVLLPTVLGLFMFWFSGLSLSKTIPQDVATDTR